MEHDVVDVDLLWALAAKNSASSFRSHKSNSKCDSLMTIRCRRELLLIKLVQYHIPYHWYHSISTQNLLPCNEQEYQPNQHGKWQYHRSVQRSSTLF